MPDMKYEQPPPPNVVARGLNRTANGLWTVGHRLGRVEEGEEWAPATRVYQLSLLAEAAGRRL